MILKKQNKKFRKRKINKQYQYKVAEEKNHLFVSDAKSFDFFKSDLH